MAASRSVIAPPFFVEVQFNTTVVFFAVNGEALADDFVEVGGFGLRVDGG